MLLPKDRGAIKLTTMSAVQLDMLNEVGNVGAGNAATSLSVLLGRAVQMKLPWTRLCTMEKACEVLSVPGEIGVGIEVHVKGQLDGIMLFTLSEDSARQLLGAFGDMLLSCELSDEMAQSALLEVGNIVTGAFLTSMSDFVKATGLSSPPSLMHDYYDAFVCNVVAAGTQGVDVVLVFKTELKVDGQAVAGELAFMPSPDALTALLERLQALEGAGVRG